MKKAKQSYEISKEAADIISDTFWGLKDRIIEGGARTKDAHMELSLAQKVRENKAFMTFVATYSDEWGTEDVVVMRRVNYATIGKEDLVIRSEGMEVRFHIRDM